MGEPFTTACTRIEGRPTGPYRGPGVEPPDYPSPAGFFLPLLREGVAVESISTLGDETPLLSALFPMHSEAQQQLWLSRVFLLLATHSTKDPKTH
jgi:hypothetical protein